MFHEAPPEFAWRANPSEKVQQDRQNADATAPFAAENNMLLWQQGVVLLQSTSVWNRRAQLNNLANQFIDSAIGQHLLENKDCGENYSDESFTILAEVEQPSIYRH